MTEPTITRDDERRRIEAVWDLGPSEADWGDHHVNPRRVAVLKVTHRGKPQMYNERGYRYVAHLSNEERAGALNREGERIGSVTRFSLGAPMVLIHERAAQRFNRKRLEEFFQDALFKAQEVQRAAEVDPGARSTAARIFLGEAA